MPARLTAQAAKIKTGQYTGDGTESHAITGIGFRPKHLTIRHRAGVGGGVHIYEKSDQTFGTFSIQHISGGGHSLIDNAIISLDADGFTVDDAGADADPNKLGRLYDYVAFG